MEFEEFQECDVMFLDYSSSDRINDNVHAINERLSSGFRDPRTMKRLRLRSCYSNKKKQQQQQGFSSSLPVNIPGNGSFRYDIDIEELEPSDEEDSDGGDQMMMRLPPHVILERRVNGDMARSFSPLKGKHLCEVRNSILRMTGFLER